MSIIELGAIGEFVGAIAVLKFYKYGSLGLASHLEAVPAPPGSEPPGAGEHGAKPEEGPAG